VCGVNLHGFLGAPRGVDFLNPVRAPALFAPDSMHWRIHKNPVTLFVGGVTAVILELAEPRVRTGVWAHSTFRTDPVARMRRTGQAAMATVYAPRLAAAALISRVGAMHAYVRGVTPRGRVYRADDPELLTWVQATASFGFLSAYDRFACRLTTAERDLYFAEGEETAALWGAVRAPVCERDWSALLTATMPALERHPIVNDFLATLRRAPLAPAPLRSVQHLLLRAAVALTPAPVRAVLGLEDTLSLAAESAVRMLARAADRIAPPTAPPVRACRRMGLPADYLYRRT
jgi:uncharacterized protein (DUF2236 family)